MYSPNLRNVFPRKRRIVPPIDWRGLSGFRNVLVHDYLGVNFTTIWKIVAIDLPELKLGIVELLATLIASTDDASNKAWP